MSEDAVSYVKIGMLLRDVVASEDKSKPLSDQAIVDELAKAGITIARRTITQFRQSMNIPSWRGRRVRMTRGK